MVMIRNRIAQLIPVVIGVTLIAFFVLNLLPGSPALAVLGDTATTSEINQFNRTHGLDSSLISRYGRWLWGLVHGNFGTSLYSGQSVGSTILNRAPVSLELVGFAIVFALVLAVPSAVLAARKPFGLFDNATRLVSTVAISVPGFVIGLLLIILLSVNVHLLPSTGFSPLSGGLGPNLRSMVLPSISLGAFLYALYLRVLRGDMVDQFRGADYVVAIRAKGASDLRVLLRHVLPNSAFGLLTVVGLNIGTLIGSAVILEQVFGLPGIGQTLVTAVFDKDSPTVEGVVVALALVVVLSNLTVDLLYALFDPRVRHGRA
jgi:peptide/nickel transport system permease protein